MYTFSARVIPMESLHSSHLREENGTPHTPPRQTRAAVSTDKNAMPPGEGDNSLRDMRRTLRVEPDGKRDGRGTILSIGDDPDLLSTRHLVLESAGYEVHSIAGNAVVEDDAISMIDLAIICHSVHEHQAAAVISTLRNVSPSLPILRLITLFGRRQNIGDEPAVRCAPDGPPMLLTQIHSMLTGFRKSATGSQAQGSCRSMMRGRRPGFQRRS